MDSRLKLFSLSDLNGRGECILNIIRADNERFAVMLDIPGLVFWSARIAAVIAKAAEEHEARKNAKDLPSGH